MNYLHLTHKDLASAFLTVAGKRRSPAEPHLFFKTWCNCRDCWQLL